MNGQNEGKLIKVGMIIFVIVVVFGLIRGDIISIRINKDYICKLEYGDVWTYDYDSNFGDTCLDLDHTSLEIVNRTKLLLTKKEAVEKYCDIPGFWELKRWTYRCEDE